jgi:hypothetical protein
VRGETISTTCETSRLGAGEPVGGLKLLLGQPLAGFHGLDDPVPLEYPDALGKSLEHLLCSLLLAADEVRGVVIDLAFPHDLGALELRGDVIEHGALLLVERARDEKVRRQPATGLLGSLALAL